MDIREDDKKRNRYTSTEKYTLGRAYNVGVDIFGEPVTLQEILNEGGK